MQRTLVIAIGVLVVVGGIATIFIAGSGPDEPTPGVNDTTVSERFVAEQLEGDYEFIKQPRMIDDELAFVATINQGTEQFVVKGGEKVGKSFYRVTAMEGIGGEPVYIGMEYRVQGDNNRRMSLYRSESLVDERNVMGMSVLDGKLAYAATEQQQDIGEGASLAQVGRNVKTSIIYDGEEYSPESGNIVDYSFVGGEFVYTVLDGNETYVVQGGERHRSFADVSEMQEIDGQLVYVGWTGDTSAQIVIDGRLGPSYDRVREVTSYNGEVAYIAGEGRPDFVVVGGEEMQRFDDVKDLSVINGKLTYAAQNDDGDWRYIHGDDGYAAYPSVGSPVAVDGSFAFIASEFGQSFVVLENESMQRFEAVNYLGSYNGEPAYIAEQQDGTELYIIGDRLQDRYQDVSFFTQTSDGPLFVAVTESGEVVVRGTEKSQVYDTISPGQIRADGSLLFAGKRDDNIYVVRHE